jgi:hypothetical protein
MPLLPLSTPGCKGLFSLEVEVAVKTKTRRGYGIKVGPRGHFYLHHNRRPRAKVLA